MFSLTLRIERLCGEREFANGLAELVKKLSCVPIAEDVNESELNTRFVDPFLCGLLDNPEEEVLDKRHNIRSARKRNLVDMSSRSYHNKLGRCEMVDQPWIRSDPSGDVLQECLVCSSLMSSIDSASALSISFNPHDAVQLSLCPTSLASFRLHRIASGLAII
ncbi:hypothetical protein G6F70_007965 [Rhizopus microsporus]|nr:hypothetical protein G6F70_007965 [Rhizopus microsporus]KAG1260457.1 hypothetical protein G6F68_007427 [Rhizopus microsporus]